MAIGYNIKTIRNLMKFKQTEFAEIVGISVPKLKSYENMGVTPKVDVQVKIASLAGITLEDLHSEDAASILSRMGLTGDKKDKTDPNSLAVDSRFVELLRSNDAFFKQQFSAYSTQIIGNINLLHRQSKRIEQLLQISLRHIGNVESSQTGRSTGEIDKIMEEEINFCESNIESAHK